MMSREYPFDRQFDSYLNYDLIELCENEKELSQLDRGDLYSLIKVLGQRFEEAQMIGDPYDE